MALPPNTEQAKKRTRRFPVWLLGCLSALMLFSFFLVGGTLIAVLCLQPPDAEIDALIAAIRERGEPVTLEELDAWYQATAPDEGAAPIYQKAFDAYVKGPKKELSEKELSILPVVGDLEIPGGEAYTQETLDAIESYLRENARALRLLHKASLQEHCRFPVDFTMGMEMPWPHLAKLRHAARLQSMRARHAAETNDAETAQQAILETLMYGSTLSNDPTLLPQLVSIACNVIAANALERVLNRCQLSGEQLEALQKAFASAQFRVSMDTAFMGERCLGADTISSVAADLKNPNIPTLSLLNFDVVRGWVSKQDLHQFLNIMEQIRLASQARFPEILEEIETINSKMDSIPPYCVLSPILVPAFKRSISAYGRDIATLRMASTAAAIERYRLAEGTIPETLDALVPEYIDTVPEDPFDGKPLRYRIDEGGYTLYTVYINQTDEGGERFKPHEEGDWNFTVERENQSPE